MKIICFIVLLFLTQITFAQITEETNKKLEQNQNDLQKSIEQLEKNRETFLQKSMERLQRTTDSLNNIRNIQNVHQLQKDIAEGNKKKLQASIFRFVLGLGFLVILIFGLRRKGKK